VVEPFIITPQAQRDFDSAYLWYEEQNQGLGKEFAYCVDEKIAEIGRSPLHFQIFYKNLVRRALVSRFPYAIYFVDKADVLSILLFFAKAEIQNDGSRVHKGRVRFTLPAPPFQLASGSPELNEATSCGARFQ